MAISSINNQGLGGYSPAFGAQNRQKVPEPPTGQQDSSTASSSSSNADTAVQDFRDYMKKTPMERLFDAWLKSHNLTEEQFNAKSPAEKKQLLDEFRQYVKNLLENKKTSTTSGGKISAVDISV